MSVRRAVVVLTAVTAALIAPTTAAATAATPAVASDQTSVRPDPPSRSAILDKVRELVAEYLGTDLGDVTDDSDFVNDLGADDTDMAEIPMLFEDEYGISIPDDVAAQMTTVMNAADYIDGVLNGS